MCFKQNFLNTKAFFVVDFFFFFSCFLLFPLSMVTLGGNECRAAITVLVLAPQGLPVLQSVSPAVSGADGDGGEQCWGSD